jgi:hypothetical protein
MATTKESTICEIYSADAIGDPVIELLSQILDGPALSAMSQTFRAIEIVGEELELAKERHPQRIHKIDEMFMTFQQQAHEMMHLREELFRSHVVEILDRVGEGVNKKELEMGTTAEVIMGLYYSSLEAPLTNAATFLYQNLLSSIIGEKAFIDMIGEKFEVYEQWPGEIAELETWARHKLRRPRMSELVGHMSDKVRQSNMFAA